ncbi:hypothetical protein [Romboutsia ilealis]|uniref:hypothetical protein n=1 Tax=Romboutsia ilealis TaxID=1115758 RepID=UPI00272C9855|nr:hypothetical protein [Romboutsia ilealis]
MYRHTVDDIKETPEKVFVSSEEKKKFSMYGDRFTTVEDTYNKEELDAYISKLQDINETIETILDKSNKVSNSIENIKKLKDGQVIDYRSNKGFINIENNNGIVSDVSLEGQTLVNILPDTWRDKYTYGDVNHEVGTMKDYFRRMPTNVKVKPNTEYTVIVTINRNSLSSGQTFVLMDAHEPGDFISSAKIYIPSGVKGLFVKKFISADIINDSTEHKTYLRTDTNCTNPGIVEISEMMIIEGDHTDKPLSYFSGLKSVGDEDDKIEIKSSSKNIIDLLDYKSKTTAGASLDVYESNKLKITTLPDNTNRYPSVWFDNFNFIPGIKYRVKIKISKSVSNIQPRFSIRQSRYNDTPLKDIGERNGNGIVDGTFIPTNRTHRIEFFGGNHVGQLADTWAIFEDIQIFIEDEDTNMESFILPENNKKQLMYYDNISNQWLKPILRSLPNGIKDTIEKHNDGKYYYHKRCEEMLLDGSEDWRISDDTDSNNIYTMECTQNSKIIKKSSSMICDKLSVREDTLSDKISTSTTNYGIMFTLDQFIRIKNSHCTSLNSFKQWLQDNNVTVVYQLANEEVYECNDLTLNLYDKSSVICESGPILPILQISVASFIGNVLNNIKDRVSKLESALYDNYLFRNKMMLQNMYSSDDTLFKVALEVMNTRDISNNEDSELLELILKNIEPGKENYDRCFMESVIDFYTIIGKISFDVADALFTLIEKQHEEVINVIE